MRNAWVAVLLVAAVTPLRAMQDPKQLKSALALYRQNRLNDALPLFERAAASDSQDPTTLAWLAETLRRVGKVERAVSVARSALALQPCHAFAHSVLGVAFNPQFGAWDAANSDSAWLHLRRAVACDPDDGNVWLNIWGEALHHGDTALAEKALRRMRETGFLTGSLLAYNRWRLRNLPENSIALANGDFDLFPALALQVTERFRRDVAVVNVPMLNLWWYLMFVHTRYGLPLPGDSAALAARPTCGTGGADTVCLGDLVLAEWRRAAAAGNLRGTIAGVDEGMFPSGPGTFVRAGALMVLRPDGSAPVDTAALRRSLEGVEGRDFAEPAASSRDRSPIRVSAAAQKSMPYHVAWTAATYGRELARANRFVEAGVVMDWLKRFLHDASLDTPDARTLVTYFEDELRRARGAP